MLTGATGVPVPTVRHLLTAGDELGEGYVMSRERGEALPQRLLSDARFAAARDKLAWQCGHALGQIHRVPAGCVACRPARPQWSDLARACHSPYWTPMTMARRCCNWALTGCATIGRAGQSKALVHGDFRNGNLLVDEGGLVAVLDWELAHLGDPVRDLGYLCANVWRFGADAPVGGFGQYDDLLAGYEAATGQRPAMDEILYWQAYAALFWGTVCLTMLEKYRSGEDASLERAAVGRRLSEAEIDLLLLLEGQIAMSGTESEELLAAVRAFLKSEVLGELDGFKAYQLRVAANALGIVRARTGPRRCGGRAGPGDGRDSADRQRRGAVGTHYRAAAQSGFYSSLDERLLSYLRHRAQLVLAIDNPRYSGLQQSLQRWGDLTNMAD